VSTINTGKPSASYAYEAHAMLVVLFLSKLVPTVSTQLPCLSIERVRALTKEKQIPPYLSYDVL